jgi:hypothetical protein
MLFCFCLFAAVESVKAGDMQDVPPPLSPSRRSESSSLQDSPVKLIAPASPLAASATAISNPAVPPTANESSAVTAAVDISSASGPADEQVDGEGEVDDDLGIPMVDDEDLQATTPTSHLTSSPTQFLDDDPSRQDNSRTREGRVSFRTQSQENITYPGLQSEPLPPLPANSTLLKTASYSKPRRKSTDKEIEEPVLPIIGGVNSTSFSNLFSMVPTPKQGPNANNTNSNMTVINASTMSADAGGKPVSLQSQSNDSMDSYGSTPQKFDEIGTQPPGNSSSKAGSGTSSKPKRPPPVNTGGDAGNDAGSYTTNSYMYISNNVAVPVRTKKRSHALKDDFALSSAYSPHQLGHNDFAMADNDLDTDYADIYPSFNLSELDIIEVCGLEMTFDDDDEDNCFGFVTPSIITITETKAAETPASAPGSDPTVQRKVVAAAPEETVVVPVMIGTPGASEVRVLARSNSVKAIISGFSDLQQAAIVAGTTAAAYQSPKATSHKPAASSPVAAPPAPPAQVGTPVGTGSKMMAPSPLVNYSYVNDGSSIGKSSSPQPAQNPKRQPSPQIVHAPAPAPVPVPVPAPAAVPSIEQDSTSQSTSAEPGPPAPAPAPAPAPSSPRNTAAKLFGEVSSGGESSEVDTAAPAPRSDGIGYDSVFENSDSSNSMDFVEASPMISVASALARKYCRFFWNPCTNVHCAVCGVFYRIWIRRSEPSSQSRK